MSDVIRALAIETTSRCVQAALVEGDQVVAETALKAGSTPTADFLPLVDRLVREHGWSPRDVAEVYVSIGPGGFTGTRVGVTFAKAFALARGAKVVAVPTPRALVENAPPDASAVLVVVDARRGSVWTEQFSRGSGQWVSRGAPGLTTMAQALASAPRPIWLVGEGLAYHAQGVDAADAGIHIVEDHTPRVSRIAAIGWRMARERSFADPLELVPAYVRRPEAEEKRLGAP